MALPAADRARKLALLDRAALQARAAALSSNKLFQMGEVAERWLELGEPNKARALFAEGRKLVETLPPQKRTDAGSFQAHLARVEPDAALSLIKDVGHDAMAATDLWEHRDPAGVRASGRGRSRAEPARGADLADLTAHRGSAGGWSATTWRGRSGSPPPCPTPPNAPMPGRSWPTAWQPSDRTGASAALDQALREIDAIDRRDASHLFDANPAVSILPLVERIAPDRVAEVFWRAVALHAPGDDPRSDFGADCPLAAEMLLLSRYDRDVADDAFRAGRGLRAQPVAPRRQRHHPCRAPGAGVPGSAGRRSRWSRACRRPERSTSTIRPTRRGITVAETLAMPPQRRWMRVWRFHSGCGIAMFEDMYRGF